MNQDKDNVCVFNLPILETEISQDNDYWDLVRIMQSKVKNKQKIVIDFEGDKPVSSYTMCRIPVMLWVNLGNTDFDNFVTLKGMTIQDRLTFSAQKIALKFFKRPSRSTRRNSSSSRFKNISRAVDIFDGNVSEMSRILGVSRVSIYSWEKSGGVPIDILEKLCEVDSSVKYKVPSLNHRHRDYVGRNRRNRRKKSKDPVFKDSA